MVCCAWPFNDPFPHVIHIPQSRRVMLRVLKFAYRCAQTRRARRCINYSTPRAPRWLTLTFCMPDSRIHPCRGQRLQLQITQSALVSRPHRSPACIRESGWMDGEGDAIFFPRRKKRVSKSGWIIIIGASWLYARWPFRRFRKATATYKTVLKWQWQ